MNAMHFKAARLALALAGAFSAVGASAFDQIPLTLDEAQSAAEAYSCIIRSGGSRIEAAEEADAVLYRGLHFSLYSTLANVIRSEFAEDIPEEDAREAALILLPQAREVARSYELTDDFAATPQYERLYTELTGTVQILLDNGIQ